jgi:hypothetical protein
MSTDWPVMPVIRELSGTDGNNRLFLVEHWTSSGTTP